MVNLEIQMISLVEFVMLAAEPVTKQPRLIALDVLMDSILNWMDLVLLVACFVKLAFKQAIYV